MLRDSRDTAPLHMLTFLTKLSAECRYPNLRCNGSLPTKPHKVAVFKSIVPTLYYRLARNFSINLAIRIFLKESVISKFHALHGIITSTSPNAYGKPVAPPKLSVTPRSSMLKFDSIESAVLYSSLTWLDKSRPLSLSSSSNGAELALIISSLLLIIFLASDSSIEKRSSISNRPQSSPPKFIVFLQ
jgi:hypothetical protein